VFESVSLTTSSVSVAGAAFSAVDCMVERFLGTTISRESIPSSKSGKRGTIPSLLVDMTESIVAVKWAAPSTGDGERGVIHSTYDGVAIIVNHMNCEGFWEYTWGGRQSGFCQFFFESFPRALQFLITDWRIMERK
jgi:hypothetical protein